MTYSLGLLVDPIELGSLVADDFAILEPEGNLLFGALDAVGSMAYVTPNINCEITSDGARCAGKRVCCAEEDAASLDGVTALPNHGADGTTQHVLDQAGEEWLLLEVGVVSLEVLLAWGDKFNGDELEAAGLETGDDGANEAAHDAIRLHGDESLLGGRHCDWRRVDDSFGLGTEQVGSRGTFDQGNLLTGVMEKESNEENCSSSDNETTEEKKNWWGFWVMFLAGFPWLILWLGVCA